MNSLQVQRMLNHFSQAHKATEAAEEVKAVRKPRAPKAKAAPPPPASDSIEDSGSDSGSEADPFGEYKEVHEIKQHFEKEPCEYISPASLGQAKTKKEAVEYLKSKNCPKVDHVKKTAAKSTMEPGPESPAPPAKKIRKTKVEAAPPASVPAPAPAPAPKVKKATAPAAAAPAAPAPPATKPKRKVSEYSKLVGKHMKEVSIAEAHKRAKAELAGQSL